jgi:hypothetical protein
MAAIVCTEVRQKSALKQLGLKVFLPQKSTKRSNGVLPIFAAFSASFWLKSANRRWVKRLLV